MLTDILTVMWKERKALLQLRRGNRQLLLVPAVLVILGLYGPLRDGPAWAAREDSVVIAAATAIVIVMITVAESFAGERERHTLETLLASRLPDRALLFGKIATPLIFAWGLALATALLGLAAVNLAHGNGQLILFSPIVALADVLLSLLAALFAAGVGVLVSMRAATVQQATQTLTLLLLVPPQILVFGLLFFGEAFSGRVNGGQLLLALAAVLLVADAVLLIAATVRFRRAQLILS